MYPERSNFTTASDNDAWWLIGYGTPATSRAVCSSGGRAFVDNLQLFLGVTQDGKWGGGTSNALIAALRSAGASSEMISGVQVEAAARRVGPGSLRGAVFLLHRGQGFGTPSNPDLIAIPPNVVPPQWNTAAPRGPSGDALPVCRSTDASATVPSVDISIEATLPPNGGLTPPLPPAPPAPRPVANSTPIILGALGLLAVGGVAWFAMQKPSSRARRNPSRLRWIVTEFEGNSGQESHWRTLTEARAAAKDLVRGGVQAAAIVDARTIEEGWSGTVVEVWTKHSDRITGPWQISDRGKNRSGRQRARRNPREIDRTVGREKLSREVFVARVGERTWQALSIAGAMALADKHAPNARSVVVRGEYTSDGTYHGPGRGRVVADREFRHDILHGGWMRNE